VCGADEEQRWSGPIQSESLSNREYRSRRVGGRVRWFGTLRMREKAVTF